MSSFWSGWITILTMINVLGCFWLIWWTSKPRPGEAAEGDVTGHTWDGDLQEYNNPLPRWWLWMFYITLIFSLAYFVIYPALGNNLNISGWSSTGQYEQEIEQAEAKYGPIFEQYASRDIADLAKDDEATQVGRRLFLNYCSQCHGSDARGAPGFPNLADDDWLYGGTPDAIQTSLLEGRTGVMPAWGDTLGPQGVEETTEYVMQMAGRDVDSAKAEKGKQHYMTYCVGCHMPDGSGNQMLGAPRLTDNTWLYGGSPGAIKLSIANGRNGRMPAHREFLGEEKVHLLSAYVYSLSGE